MNGNKKNKIIAKTPDNINNKNISKSNSKNQIFPPIETNKTNDSFRKQIDISNLNNQNIKNNMSMNYYSSGNINQNYFNILPNVPYSIPNNKNNSSLNFNNESQSENIKVCVRIRPLSIQEKSRNDIKCVEVYSKDQLLFIHKDKKKSYTYNLVLGENATQEDTFSNCSINKLLNNALDGYTVTIFAYGQTGSGKTYTITGGVESINLRGIIPRALSYIFEEIRKRTLFIWKVYISYLEIYNNDGYDLLYENNNFNDPSKRYELENLPRVRIRENQNKQLILTNLSIHEIDNFQEGMALLMLGDENRVVVETPKNDASTRSHCLFMIQIESQKIGEDKKILSKLHIVDLSGSEKPTKTELSGIRMTEALNINMSLFRTSNNRNK